MNSQKLTAAVLSIASVLREAKPLTVEFTYELMTVLLGADTRDEATGVLVMLEDCELAEAREGGWYRGPKWSTLAAIHAWQI